MQRRTVVSSFNTAILSKIRALDTGRLLRYSLITNSAGAASVATVRAAGTVYMPDYRTLTDSSVAAYRAAGIELWVWPVRDALEMAGAARLRPDVLVADDPVAAQRWLTPQRGCD
jgi:glycerophosphoryl diester phosphodiesterase